MGDRKAPKSPPSSRKPEPPPAPPSPTIIFGPGRLYIGGRYVGKVRGFTIEAGGTSSPAREGRRAWTRDSS